ncbi:MAG: PAS domain-containing protein [Fimbriimonadaceae bacterium]|nr:PAS domain-containing protein [Chitinophagales bacterium]
MMQHINTSEELPRLDKSDLESKTGIWVCLLEKNINVLMPVPAQIDLIYKSGYIIDCNDAFAKMYGFTTASEMTGKKLQDFFLYNEQNLELLTSFITSGYNLSGVESKEMDAERRIVYFINTIKGILINNTLIGAKGEQEIKI